MATHFINLHTHLPSHDPAVLAVRNLHQRDGLPPENFAACTVGLHPWFLEKESLETDFQWLAQNSGCPNVLAIGECGLDRAVAVPMDLQETAFLRQAELAETLGKPMILHCVRAHERLAQMRKTLRPRQPWIFHGFDKHPQTARMLLGAGCHLSFGAALFRENSHAADALRQTPTDRFFLETDDKSLEISAIYERAAHIFGIKLDDLAAQVQANFQHMFPHFPIP